MKKIIILLFMCFLNFALEKKDLNNLVILNSPNLNIELISLEDEKNNLIYTIKNSTDFVVESKITFYNKEFKPYLSQLISFPQGEFHRKINNLNIKDLKYIKIKNETAQNLLSKKFIEYSWKNKTLKDFLDENNLLALAYLLQKDNSILNEKDENGYTIVSSYLFQDAYDIVEIFLNTGADLALKNEAGWDYLTLAGIWGKDNIIELLKEYALKNDVVLNQIDACNRAKESKYNQDSTIKLLCNE